MMVHFARSMADEIRASNEAGQPAGWILPVGLRDVLLLMPVATRSTMKSGTIWPIS